jgi:hypothetical protein
MPILPTILELNDFLLQRATSFFDRGGDYQIRREDLRGFEVTSAARLKLG